MGQIEITVILGRRLRHTRTLETSAAEIPTVAGRAKQVVLACEGKLFTVLLNDQVQFCWFKKRKGRTVKVSVDWIGGKSKNQTH
jgi:hypothetical protein